MNIQKRFYINSIILFSVIVLFTVYYLFCVHTFEYDVISHMEMIDSPVSDFCQIRDHELLYSLSEDQLEDADDIFEEYASDYDREPSGIPVFRAPVPNLPFGVYSIKTEYICSANKSQSYVAESSLSLIPGREDAIIMNASILDGYKQFNDNMFWVRNFSGSNYIDKEGNENPSWLYVYATAPGEICMKSITISDYFPWKICVLLSEFLVFGLIIVFVKLPWFRSAENRLFFVGGIALILFSSIPALCMNMEVYRGNDLAFHLTRIASIADEMRHFNFPVIYQPDANLGHGYVANIMYGNILLYFPALLHIMGFSLADAYNFYVIFVNALTVLIAYFSFRGITGRVKYGCLGTVIYTLAAIRLSNIYNVAAVGEYTAQAFLPLLIYSLFRIFGWISSDKDKHNCIWFDILPLIISVTGMIQTHVLTVAIVIPFVITFLMLHLKDTFANLYKLLLSGVVIILLNSFFLIPFLSQFSEPMVINANKVSENIWSTGVYIGQLFAVSPSVLGVTQHYATKGDPSYALGGALIIGFVLCICVIVINKPADRFRFKLAAEGLALSIISIFMSSVFFPWDSLAGRSNVLCKFLTVIQFTCRYEVISTVIIAFLTVYAIRSIGESNDISRITHIKASDMEFAVSCITFCVAALVAGSFFSNYMNQNSFRWMHTISGNMWVDNLYRPVGADVDTIYNLDIQVEDPDIQVADLGMNSRDRRVFYVNNIENDSYITIPVLYYSFMGARDTYGNWLDISSGANSNIEILIPGGYEGTIVVEPHIPLVWYCGYIISFITFAGLGIICWKNYYQKNYQNL